MSELQATTKAVVFTHISMKMKDIKEGNPDVYVELYTPLFERYLQCGNVGLVYMYLSLGIEQVIGGVKHEVAAGFQQTVEAVAAGKDLVIPIQVLTDEAVCLDILQLAEYKAREKYPDKPLKFIRVTTFQLASLLRNLYKTEPKLIEFLRGADGVFTYDSPKFVEAVIRIVRGQDSELAHFPVIRFDEDVRVCEKSLDILLTKYENLRAPGKNTYFFFSGSYGDPEHPNELDPINDRAVRSHWFGKWVGAEYELNHDNINLFWRDLGEVGATQLVGRDSPLSKHGKELIGIKPGPHTSRRFSINRNARQVISGAGLIMSFVAIRDLPPFMNVNRLIVWIDDFLKRQLHEMIDHIRCDERESVTEAKFKQCRHPDGIQAKDIKWAKTKYFDALLAGCMMDAVISQPAQPADQNNGKRIPTRFSQAIRDIIDDPKKAGKIKFATIKPALQRYVEQRYDEVLFVWRTPEFKDTALYKWAGIKLKDPSHKTTLVDDVLKDASAYLELVKLWRVSFAAAIGGLRNIGNFWLFEPVR
jgi:hypothetical protein